MTLLTQKLKENNRKVHTPVHIRLQELGIGFVCLQRKINYQQNRL
jgi:hypothetical protein